MSPSSKSPGPEVLICGSDNRDLAVVRQLIGRQGYSVETARTPVNAIQQTRVSPFQAVVFLLEDGDEVWLETIAAFNDLFPALPVIVLADHGSLETERRARQSKIFYYVLRPVDGAEIKAVLRDATGARTNQNEAWNGTND